MLRKLSQRISSEDRGFTLIELLVVILIIGILAAIALPAFLGQQQKGQDASSKSDARNLVSQIESCYATEQTYTNCTFSGNSLNGQSTGLKIGAGAGSVTATLASDGFTVLATSSSSDVFTITKSAATSGANQRTCTPVSSGGCPANGNW